MSDFVKSALSPVIPALKVSKQWVNDACRDLEPWQIVLYTSGTTVAVIMLKDFLFQEESLKTRTTKTFFNLVKKIPAVKRKIDRELGKARHGILAGMNKGSEGSQYVQNLPRKGLTEDELFSQLQKYKGMANEKWQEGMISGTVYSGEEKLTQIITKTFGMFAWTNPLHAEVFPDIRKMEAEVVRMCCTMFNGDQDTCGSMTSGGTESIMLACLAYRNIARERGIKVPEIIVPVTAHAAFDKAAEFFHMTITHIPVDEITRKVDVRAMRWAISKRTCVLVASAPAFPHGIIDPVQEVAALGLKYNIPVHVDSCLGGFLVPFMDKAGFPLAPFDFRVQGVTSISADTHKYGFAPKGSSVIMFRKTEYRQRHFFVQPNWPGGIYASPTIGGSRAGAIIAACWATMMYFGEQGYIESTRAIVSTARHIEQELRKIKGIFVFGKPEVSVIGIGSNDFDIFRLFEVLIEKEWVLNSLQFPSSIHLCITLPTTQPGVADHFVADVKAAVENILKDPKSDCAGIGAIYGMAQSVPDRSMVTEIARCFLETCYNTKTIPLTDGDSLPNGLSNHVEQN